MTATKRRGLLAEAAKLGHAAAAYDLALMYLEGTQFPQDVPRAAELFRQAAQAGNPEAQYALATLYKEGKGVPKDEREAARLLGVAALADNVDAQVEYGIALVNGTGVAKNEKAAYKYLSRAAFAGSAIAQNRLAPHVYERHRRHCRSSHGHQMAYHCQGQRTGRPADRRLRGETAGRCPHRRTKRRQTMASDHR